MPYSMVTAQQGHSTGCSEMVGDHYWAMQVLRSNRGGGGGGVRGVRWEYTDQHRYMVQSY